MKTIRVVAAVICDSILDVIRSSMQPVKPLHTSEYDNEPLQRC